MHMTARIFQHAYLPLHLHRENLWDYKWSRDPTHVFVVKFGGIMDPAILLAIQRDPRSCVKLRLGIKRDHTYIVS